VPFEATIKSSLRLAFIRTGAKLGLDERVKPALHTFK